MKKTRIAIVRPSEYGSVQEAVSEALGLLGADEILGHGENVLLKPNLTLNIKNASTEKDFITGVCRALKDYTEDISLGDSCGMPSTLRTPDVLRDLSIDKAMEQENIAYVEFEADNPLKVKNPHAKLLKEYHIARAIGETRTLINLPRPKCHIVAYYTGAVKNYFGIIPGGQKPLVHQYGRDPLSFAQVLADNFSTLRRTAPKRLTIMDARKYMEGVFAPAGGIMRKTDILLASTDEVAVDMVMLALGNVDGRVIPHLRLCMEQGLGVGSLDDMEILGLSLDEARLKRKLKVIGPKASGFADFFARKFVYKAMRVMPFLIADKCTSCGDCADKCPENAIAWQKEKKPELNKESCVSCLSCVAACKENALKGRPAMLKGLFVKNKQLLCQHLPEKG